MRKKTQVSGHHTHRHSLPKNHCFGCGKDNANGMRLRFFIDENSQRTICNFKLSKRYQGPPGHAHGGIIATILDEAMGKVNKLRSVVALTKTMELEYVRPVPLGVKLTVVGHERRVEGRKHINAAEIRNAAGEVLARGEGLFIAVDTEKLFAKHLPG